ncbi:TGF-beta-activated kinase 1 and MAP3K7-binding protein 1-like [Haliotis asinina]|uniref:TGF-beta-activated kinase 1 and MAP3K7-binding protein 1-like n=1 Tax=Haliotis asinina TaxID=109174 RepID=UPI0035323BF9
MTDGRLTNGSVGHPPRLGMQGHALSWTDDLPVCYLSGVGFSTNQIYRDDGHRREEHEFEDKSFHFRPFDGCFLYGMFDGHSGSKAANFAAQRMPAELLFGQLNNKITDEAILGVLRQAFHAVEKGYFETIDDLLAQRTTCMLELPDGITQYEAFTKYPDIVNKLQQLDLEIAGGTTASVVLIYNEKLYVANVGDSRVLLVVKEDNRVRVMQLTYDHTLNDELEQRRITKLGLDVERLKQLRKIGNSDNTRCIGDYHVKGGYKDIDILRNATSEPVIAEPHLEGGVQLSDNTCFLIIMSDGLYQALQDATGTEKVNVEITSMVLQEFGNQSTLNGVAQAVVDKVVRIHHDTYMTAQGYRKQLCQKRDDITLLVRNFNQNLGNGVESPTAATRYNPVPVSLPPFFNTPPPAAVPSLNIPSPISPSNSNYSHSNLSVGSYSDSQPLTPTNNPGSQYLTTETTMGTRTSTGTSTNSTQSSGDARPFQQRYQAPKLELDENGRVEAYVDFSDFFRAIERLTGDQQACFEADVNPKSSYDPISEESETATGPED